MCHRMLSAVGLILPLATVAAADDVARAPKADEQIAKWIKQLDSDSFTERERASQELRDAGNAAIEALTEAAVGRSPESATRAQDILIKHLGSDDEALKEAARKGLEKIAAGPNEGAARRAEEVLKPAPAPDPVPRGIRIAPAKIQIEIRNVRAGNRRVSTRIVDGVKTIEGEEDGRKFKIVEDADKSVTVELTEKKDGKESTETYKAKSPEELKKAHPEAFKLYEEYSKPEAQIRVDGIEIRGADAPRVRIPDRRGGRRAGPPDAHKQARESLDKAARQIGESIGQLKKLAAGADDAEAFQKALEQLEDAMKQLEEAGERLDR